MHDGQTENMVILRSEVLGAIMLSTVVVWDSGTGVRNEILFCIVCRLCSGDNPVSIFINANMEMAAFLLFCSHDRLTYSFQLDFFLLHWANQLLCAVSQCCGGTYCFHVDVGVLGCNTVLTCSWIPTFQRNILLPSSGLKMGWYVTLKQWYLSESQHDIRSQKTNIGIFTTVSTSNPLYCLHVLSLRYFRNDGYLHI
jgi:hypothetical protein